MEHCLFVGADTADAMGCVFLPQSRDHQSKMGYIRKCLQGEYTLYHPGHRDRANLSFSKDTAVNMAKFDPRGVRFQIWEKYAHPRAFWALEPEENRCINALMLYRWQRGGPTAFFKQAYCNRYFACDFRKKSNENQPLGFSIPLALLWITVFSDSPTMWSTLCNASPFQQQCIDEYIKRLKTLFKLRKITVSDTCLPYGNCIHENWDKILRAYAPADAIYVIMLHIFQLDSDNVIETYIEGIQFCLQNDLCVFSIGTAILQILLLKNISQPSTQALLDFWKQNLQHTDAKFLNDNTFYDYKNRGRFCPSELSHDYWTVLLSKGTKELETCLSKCLSES